MMSLFKKLVFCLGLTLLIFGFSFPLLTESAEVTTEYTPLATVEPIQNGNSTINVANYIPNAVKVIIQVAGALAVIMIVIGGIQYLSTDAIQGKEEGKQKIQNAVYGLLLALGAFIILNTLNPKTLSFDLSLQPVCQGVGCAATPGATTTGPIQVTGNWLGKPWPSSWPNQPVTPTDASVRSTLGGLQIPVYVNNPNCPTIGSTSCTSLDGLSSRVMSGIQALSTLCYNNAGCRSATSPTLSNPLRIVITGGTEYWLHGNRQPDPAVNTVTAHRPGGTSVDFRKHPALDQLIRSFPRVSSGCANGQRYNVNGAIYVDEVGGDPHWHVCY